MSQLFLEPELLDIAAEIELQLQEVQQMQAIAFQKTGENPQPEVALVKQTQTIAALTKEPPQSFLVKFGQAAKADLCEESGLLHKSMAEMGRPR
jgi:hypothetical protein